MPDPGGDEKQNAPDDGDHTPSRLFPPKTGCLMGYRDDLAMTAGIACDQIRRMTGKHLGGLVMRIRSHGSSDCNIFGDDLLVSRLATSLRASSASNNNVAPMISGPKIHKGNGVVPNIWLPIEV